MQITMSGFPGAGKGTLKRTLAEELGIKHFSVGDLRREYAEQQGLTIQELNRLGETNSQTDRNADEYQQQWAQENPEFLLEGRLSYYFLPTTIKLFLTVSPEVGARRILSANRGKSETKCKGLREQIRTNRQRCESDINRYRTIYGIQNPYEEENFDIVIDTTKLTPKQILQLAVAKIIDYQQKMNPPTFYLAHPTESKKTVREWEMRFEEESGIDLHNPFYDGDSLETLMGESGKEKYKKMPQAQLIELFGGDLKSIADERIIGGIFIIDNQYTLGTPAELMATKLMGKLAYTVITHTDTAYRHHPALELLSDKTFSSTQELEAYLKQNRGKLFRELEKSRQRTERDPTFKAMHEVIRKNHEFLAVKAQ